MERKINTALVGFGMTARVMHAPFLATAENYNVTTVVERHKEDSKTIFPNAQIVRSLEEVLEDKDVELVIITTPNSSHYTYAQQALQAGKHVVLEKPFTITSTDAAQLVQTAKEEEKVLSPFHNRRYVADFRTMQQLLQQNLLGDVHTFEGHFDRYRPQPKPNAWREEALPGSGILYDLGPHLIDQALCLFGLPQTITADVKKQRSFSVVDDAFELKMDYGFLQVVLKSGMLVREPGPRYQIHGTLGSYIKWGEDVQEALLKEGALPNVEGWGAEPQEQYGLLHTEKDGDVIKEKYPSLPGNFGLYYQNLYNTIVNSAELKEKGEHGYNTIKLIELAFRSADEKRTLTCEGLMDAAYPQG
ncbi:MAG: Gfo/Idh/MocA family oxidoreductase [Chitinophagaceae bacterium]